VRRAMRESACLDRRGECLELTGAPTAGAVAGPDAEGTSAVLAGPLQQASEGLGRSSGGSRVAAQGVVCGDLDDNDRYPVGIR
jgi:hypothetical protein